MIRLHVVRMAHGRARTDGFVRILRVLLRLVGVGRLRQELRAVFLPNQLAHFGQRFIGNAGGVGTHVGDQTNRALVAEIDAFIQPLGDHHGALHAETQLARGILLELAGGKRRSRTATAFALFHRANVPVGLLQRGAQLFGLFRVGNRRLLVTDPDKARA